MTIGSNIRKYRKEKNLTQKELAELVGISQNSIQRYETEQREPTFEQLKTIALALNISVTKLIAIERTFSIPNNIKAIREEQNISRKQFANELGVSEEEVIKFETVPKSVSHDMFNKICNILNITNTELFTRSDVGIEAHKRSIAIEGFLSLCLYLGINIELEPDEDGNLLQANIRYKDIDFNIDENAYNNLFKEVCNSITKEVLNSQFYDFLGY